MIIVRTIGKTLNRL